MDTYDKTDNINAWVAQALHVTGFTYMGFSRHYGVHRNTVANWCKEGHPVPKGALLELSNLIAKGYKAPKNRRKVAAPAQ